MGTGRDATIKEIAQMVSDIVGFYRDHGVGHSKPDGTPQKLLDVSKLAEGGWTAKIELREGLESTVEWYRAHVGAVRQ